MIENDIYKKKLKEIENINKERNKLFQKIGSKVFEHINKKRISTTKYNKHKKIFDKIIRLNKDRISKKEALKRIPKKTSKLEKYKKEGKIELDLRPKKILTLAKITSRNIFEKAAKEFKDIYGNLRDYQKVFHQLTRTGGEIEKNGRIIYVKIDNFSRKSFKEKINKYFKKINGKKLETIDKKYILQFKWLL